MPRMNLNEVIELLNQNSLTQGTLLFKDDEWRNWRIELDIEYFPADDSIPESELTDDDRRFSTRRCANAPIQNYQFKIQNKLNNFSIFQCVNYLNFEKRN